MNRAVLLAAAVLAALLVGWTTPPGTGLAILALAVTVGVLVLHGCAAHQRGVERVRAARHAEVHVRIASPKGVDPKEIAAVIERAMKRSGGAR